MLQHFPLMDVCTLDLFDEPVVPSKFGPLGSCQVAHDHKVFRDIFNSVIDRETILPNHHHTSRPSNACLHSSCIPPEASDKQTAKCFSILHPNKNKGKSTPKVASLPQERFLSLEEKLSKGRSGFIVIREWIICRSLWCEIKQEPLRLRVVSGLQPPNRFIQCNLISNIGKGPFKVSDNTLNFSIKITCKTEVGLNFF